MFKPDSGELPRSLDTHANEAVHQLFNHFKTLHLTHLCGDLLGFVLQQFAFLSDFLHQFGVCHDFTQNVALKGLLRLVHPVLSDEHLAQVLVEDCDDSFEGSEHFFALDHINRIDALQVRQEQFFRFRVLLLEPDQTLVLA